MSKTEMITRADSIYEWIQANRELGNPQIKGVVAYWVRLVKLIHNL